MSEDVPLILGKLIKNESHRATNITNEFIRLLRAIITFLMVSSLFIATTGFFETYIGYLLFGFSPNIPICFAVFLMTFSVYGLDKITDSKEDTINMPERQSFLAGRRRVVLCYSLAAYALSALIILLDKPLALPIIFIPLAANAAYGSKLIPGVSRFKDIPVVKNLVVAGSWALVTTLLPAMQITQDTDPVISYDILYFMLAKVFINAVLYDVRDIKGDREMGVRTMPVILGPRKTTAILLGLNSTLLPCLIYIEHMLRPLALIMILYGYAYIIYFAKRRRPIVLDFFVDGQWMIAAILFPILRGLGLS
ncbi:MAG: UbiA family prenyltransferase [Methanothrix sp.]|nr:UbiA family prenyltransferase [Methanothrix sp.]